MAISNNTEAYVSRPEGAITSRIAEDFRVQLNDLIIAGVRDLTIDLSAVDLIDSKGLAVFIVCHQNLQQVDGKLTVLTPNENLLELFREMRLDQHFSVVNPNV